MGNWEKFDKAIDTEGLRQDVKEAADNGGGGNYAEVPHGTYEVKIEKLELKESSKGDPMVSVWMRILTGDYEKSCIFMNQVITQGFQIHIMNEFLRSLDSGIEVEFNTYSQYDQMLMDIHEAIDGTLEFCLEYGKGKKDFNTYKITEVYEVN